VLLLHRSEAEAQIDLALRQAPITITARSAVESTSALVAGAAFRGALGKDRQSEVQVQMQVRVRVQVQVQRPRDLTVSRAGGSTAAKTVAKGPLAFQEQNCRGWLREMSRPIMLPPVATSKAPLTWAQSGSFADRAQAQNLDAAPPPPMHHVGMERHDSRRSELLESTRVLAKPSVPL
jgi:hypothetical protein